MSIKVCFLSWHFQSPELFLQTLLKMTPNRSGKWQNMEAVTDPFKADFCCVFDGYSGPMPEDRVIYFGQHPDCCKQSFRRWGDKKALLRLPLDKFLNPGEWWISHDYDTLIALQPPAKTKKAICAITYQTHNPMYAQRPLFMAEYFKNYTDIDLYGRPQERFQADPVLRGVYKGCLGFDKPDGKIGQHLVGKDVLIDYRYSVEFDVGPTNNFYFSERFYDALLLWAMPIYFGSESVHIFIPYGSFLYFDAFRCQDIHRINSVINSDVREQSLPLITQARELLLNKYQTWPYVYDVVTNINKYKEMGA